MTPRPDDFDELWRKRQEKANEQEGRGQDGVGTESSWRPVDLTDALAGVDIPAPTMLARTDGIRLVYAGRTHVFAGESESCKSWAAQIGCSQVMGEGGDVLWIDFEDDERGVVARLLALMVPP